MPKNIIRLRYLEKIKHLKLKETKWLKQTLILYPFLITINDILVGTIDPGRIIGLPTIKKTNLFRNLILYEKVITQ